MRRIVTLLPLLALLLTGCVSDRAGSAEPLADARAAPVQATTNTSSTSRSNAYATEGAAAEMQTVSLDATDKAQAAQVAVERKIIRNAAMTIEIDDPADASRDLSSIAESNGGFVVTSETQRSSGTPKITVTARVPADRFGAAVDAIRELGGRVLSDKVTGQDVTEEYIDLEARIRTSTALEQQFIEIMKQARTVADALQVQREIATVRTEIERLEGRRRYLENQSSLSTIVVTLQPPAPVVGTTSHGFIGSIREAFGDSIDTGTAIILGFIRLIGFLVPVALLIGFPVWLLVRMLVRRLKPRRPAAAESAP